MAFGVPDEEDLEDPLDESADYDPNEPTFDPDEDDFAALDEEDLENEDD